MNTWKSWHNGAPRVMGILLLLVPFVFGIATLGTPFWGTWVLGMVVGVAAVFLSLLWWLPPHYKVTEAATVLVGTVLGMSPWALGGSGLTLAVWASCILGVCLVFAAGSVLIGSPNLEPAVQRDMIGARAAYARRLSRSRQSA